MSAHVILTVGIWVACAGLMNIFLLAFEWISLGKEKWYESLAGSWVMDLVWYSAEMARDSADDAQIRCFRVDRVSMVPQSTLDAARYARCREGHESVEVMRKLPFGHFLLLGQGSC